MRRWRLILPAALLGLIAWALATGADARLAAWAAGWQREFQNALADALRALRAGEPGALALLAGLCFGYGVVHAVGPGHGKVLIGGYGVGRRVPVLRLSAIAVAASLGQAVTAIALVGIGVLVLGWSRSQATGLADGAMALVSAVAIGLIGLWLTIRGARRLFARSGAEPAPAGGHDDHDVVHHHHDHHHDHDHDHEGCTHRHGPTVEEVQAATRPRDVAALIGSIAIRPCSGALLLLVLTWHMGIWAAGIAGTVAMALGTGAVTVAVAIAAVTARESTLTSLAGETRLARLLPLVELLAGLVIALVALRMVTGA